MSDPALPLDLVRPGRQTFAVSAMLLPFTDGRADLDAFAGLVERTLAAGLVPAVNMDTGYANLLSPSERGDVLARAQAVAAGAMVVAGAWVDDDPGARFDPAAQLAAVTAVADVGAVPVVFPNYALASLDPAATVAAHHRIGAEVDRFIGFELSTEFSPTGTIWDLDTYAGVMAVPACIGAKHSSLQRRPEWDRVRLRDADRPDFHVFTGNDLAIDQVIYGCDYLLGLSAFAPDLFAARDRAWADGDATFAERNDDLQALGTFAFRHPVPGYKHDAAMYLHHRGWIPSAEPHPQAPRRPGADAAVLAALHRRLARWEVPAP
ncbi:MAG: dihydrodipicolinate synthase family protein [Acidimicrobiales bacterium]